MSNEAKTRNNNNTYFFGNVNQLYEKSYKSSGMLVWRPIVTTDKDFNNKKYNGIEILLGVERKKNCLGIFGGLRDWNDIDSIQTAVREFKEETNHCMNDIIYQKVKEKL